MTTTVRPWYEDLTDSVTALREAAYEYKIAERSLKSLRDSVHLSRRHIEEGRIHALPRVNEREGFGWAGRPQSRRPHATAIHELSATYGRLLGDTRGAFEHASMLFASGTCWAIAQVQKGNTPDCVAFERDPQDVGQLTPRSLEIVGLDRYAEARRLTAAYDQLASCMHSAEVGEDLAGRDYVADHEASEMWDAFHHADGIGPAAYAYGRLAENVLRFTLLPIRHAKPATTAPIPPQSRPADAE